MAKIKIDLRNIQEKPGLMIGLGALGALFVLVVFLVFASLFAPKAVAEAPTPTATSQPTSTPTATLAPTRLPPTATPTPVPISSLLWAPDHTGAYMRREPGGEILDLVPNGTELVLLEETEKMGGLDWQAIEQDGQYGWVVAEFVHQVEGTPSYSVAAEGGAFLREAPHGKVIAWLSKGVPVVAMLEQRDDTSVVWDRVLMPGGKTGWVADFLLDPTSMEGGE